MNRSLSVKLLEYGILPHLNLLRATKVLTINSIVRWRSHLVSRDRPVS
ncbi:hypothetical protein QUA56_13230 [Microcoleus sp. N3A4]